MGARKLLVQTEDGLPQAFRYRGRYWRVAEVLERWRDTGRWWAREAPKLFFRVLTAGGGMWEIYLDLSDRTWHLYRVYD